ncbi:hypothetical protein CDEST_07859 [Colletotrichum destructivum]|uniref:Uncharacterized protein n=1 Tax=Colletotrichum destructivum TaxID=34406 RepID=A0AAX4IIE3_9PEZI|nr:hypothetical protein CDEST_07859 [Colletotrichum destructivum]
MGTIRNSESQKLASPRSPTRPAAFPRSLHASSRMDGGGKASAPLEHHLIAVILKGVGSG